jgi:hypothetical protein
VRGEQDEGEAEEVGGIQAFSSTPPFPPSRSSLKASKVNLEKLRIPGERLIGDEESLEGVGVTGIGMKMGAAGNKGAVGVEGDPRPMLVALESVKRWLRRLTENVASRGEGGARLRGFEPTCGGGGGRSSRVGRTGVTGGS